MKRTDVAAGGGRSTEKAEWTKYGASGGTESSEGIVGNNGGGGER